MLSKKTTARHKHSRLHARTGGLTAPKHALDMEERSPRNAYELVHDEMFFDANPRLNMASFVTTWMEPEASQLMMESLDKNLIDKPIYPQTLDIQNRCVSIIAELFHADEDAAGTATVGSSEAIHLAGLVMKWNWKKWYQTKYGKDAALKPNMIMGSNVQVCWKKFARYFEVDLIEIPLTKENRLDEEAAIARVDDNTIGVVGILGNTYSGEFDDIKQLDTLIDQNNKKYNREVPLHVDAASGGGVAPFTHEHKDIVWDFRLKWVNSINMSGHKYGLVYPGIGWAIWKSKSAIPKDLIFDVDYLGESQEDFGLNFSRGAGQIIAQYYNFVRYGHKGYSRIMNNLMDLYSEIKPKIVAIKNQDGVKMFDLVSHDKGLPLICISVTKEATDLGYTMAAISHRSREKGWVLPVYPMSAPKEGLTVMRMVLKQGFNSEMGDKLVDDITWAVNEIMQQRKQLSLSHGAHGIC
ncbi:MAG: glutamate decarboxylase [Methylomonas lenta]|nr:glutamate decarboxylase [Methylomonas lenta]